MGCKKEVTCEAAKDATSLGNLVLQEGLLTTYELGKLLYEFKGLDIDQMLGQFLIQKGVLSPEKLEILMIKQATLRNGGVEESHITQMRSISYRTEKQVTDSVDQFLACASAFTVK